MEDSHESEPKKPDTAAAVNWVAGGRGAEVASNLKGWRRGRSASQGPGLQVCCGM